MVLLFISHPNSNKRCIHSPNTYVSAAYIYPDEAFTHELKDSYSALAYKYEHTCYSNFNEHACASDEYKHAYSSNTDEHTRASNRYADSPHEHACASDRHARASNRYTSAANGLA